MAEHLGGGAAVKALARAIEPAPDSDIVVRAREVADDEGQEVEPGGDRVRRGAVGGNVAPCTGLGDAQKTAQQVHTQDALQGAPFVRGGRRLVEGLVDLLQQGGKPGGIGARQAVEFRKEVATDTGFGHARLEPLYGGIVQAGNRSREQAHCVGASQCPDSR